MKQCLLFMCSLYKQIQTHTKDIYSAIRTTETRTHSAAIN